MNQAAGFRYFNSLILFLVIIIGCLNAQNNYDIETKLLANDGAVDDYFGAYVSISGNTAIMSAYLDDDNGSNSGSAYIYQFDGNNWHQSQKLTPSDGAAEHRFGISVSINGDYAIIGADLDDNGAYSGGAYIFHFDGSSWVQQQKLIASDGAASDFFGRGLAISGNWAIVGASGDDDNGDHSGSAYIFYFNGSNWVEHQKLTAIGGIAGDSFGRYIEIEGGTVYISATGDNDNGDHAGAVYVFGLNGNTWVPHAKLLADDGASNDYFGCSISSHEKKVLIGAYRNGGAWTGSAYVFEFTGINWIQQQKLRASDIYANDQFGTSVSMNQNTAIIGSPGDENYTGSSYIYHFNGYNWVEQTKITATDAAISDYFGYDCAIENNTVVVGAFGGNDNGSFSGSAYIYELIARPKNVEIADGIFNNRNKISWRNRSAGVEHFKIYRDGEYLDIIPAGAQGYNDYDGVPGKLYTYGVSAYNSAFGESPVVTSWGWQRPNGKIDGSVKTNQGAGVSDVKITVSPTNSDMSTCLEFDGNDDFVIKKPVASFPDTAMTISFWMKTSDAVNEGTPISYATDSEYNSFLIYNYRDFSFRVNNQYSGATGVSANDGIWHHIAVTWRSSDGQLNLYKDGIVSFTGNYAAGYSFPGNGALVFGQEQDGFGGVFDSTQAFMGRLDEIRIWDFVRDSVAIQSDMEIALSGTESGLISYWSFDDSSRSSKIVAGDYAQAGGNHALIDGPIYKIDSLLVRSQSTTDVNGDYQLQDLYYEELRSFDIVPVRGDHGFYPVYRNRNLTLSDPSASQVNFTDTTTFTIGGNVKFINTSCNVEGVEILLDGNSTGIYTDASGNFMLSIAEPGNYTFSAYFTGEDSSHTFFPVDTTLFVNGDMTNLQFWDVAANRLSGVFEGSCNSYIGMAEFVIQSTGNNSGCYRDTITTDANGLFDIFLPAQIYTIELISINPTNPLVVQYFDIDTVDITWEDQYVDFIYRTAPVIKISGVFERGCGAYDQIPIMNQYYPYQLLIEVFDVSATNDSCYVNEGSVTIYDAVGDSINPITVGLDSGKVLYLCVPGKPNILTGGAHPFQKLLQIEAEVGTEIASLDQWVLVIGHRPRQQTFVATTPELPSMILRDPPGDQSFSFLEKDSTFSVSTTHSVQGILTGGVYANLQTGLVVSPLFFEVGAYLKYDVFFNAGYDQTSGNSEIHTITAKQEIRTSDGDIVVGEDGDVFIGASLNNLYALTDIIDYDPITCIIIQDSSLAWSTIGFNTTFIYTESHINNTLIPQLKELRSVALSNNDSLLYYKYDSSIKVWQQTISYNDSLKNIAHFERNLSFSAGVAATYSSTTTKQDDWSLNYALVIEEGAQLGIGGMFMGNEVEGGVTINMKYDNRTIQNTSISNTTTIGYSLGDDDPGDFFSIDVKQDETFGTPVFDLIAGRSSCPYENGTQPRDGTQLLVAPAIQNNVPPDQPATFTLNLGNTSQSGETRDYYLSVIQSTNFDGAIIRVGGVVISDYLEYTIPAGQQITATMAIERGPIAYSYPNLQLRLYSPCDPSIADTVTFSVNYISPCSQVDLFRPYNNWLVNQASNDSLQVIIRDYDLNNLNLVSVGFEFRKVGEDWNTAFIILKADLPVDFINKNWDVSNLLDGNYEVRATAKCGSNGINYSQISSGVIDRNTLMVFGTPQPADGILHLGEDISITFTGDLDCGRVTSEGQITLTQLSDTSQVPINVACSDKTIIITIDTTLSEYENEALKARVANIYDQSGNRLEDAVEWQFVVNMNPVYWTVSNGYATIYQNNSEAVTGELYNAHGTNTESFTITDYQYWLTPDIISGQIPPGGNQSVSFTISDQLNPGSYTDTVYAVTTLGSEAFIINATVLSEPPIWTVNPSGYQYTMSITAEVSLNNIASDDELDMVSAYVGGEVRGVANFQYEQTIDGYLAFITIYSNNTTGEEITFRYWDASENIEYGGVSETVYFTNNSTVGTLLNPLTLHPSGIAQNISLNTGWNWFSTNVEDTDMTLASVLEVITANDGDMIKGQTNFSQYVAGTGWTGTLSEVETGESYQLQLTNTDELWYAGNPINLTTTSIDYEAGWNWIGYFPHENLPINTALQNLNATHGDRIKSQTEYAEYDDNSNSWIGSLQILKPGEGYLLKTTNSGSFTYSGGTTFNRKGNPNQFTPNSTLLLTTGIPDWQVSPADYEFTMNMIGVLNIRGVESADSSDIIAAFVNNECRGFTQPVYIADLNKYEIFLTVYSNTTTGETIEFKIYDADNDEEIDADVTTTFTADVLNGTVQQPFVFEVQDLNAPGLESAFHYSTEAGLARYVKLYISSDETLNGNPQVEITNTYSTQNYSTTLFDATENIYVLNYYVEDLGQSEYIMTATDFAGNTAIDTVSLNVQTLGKTTVTTFTMNEMLKVTIPANNTKDTGYLYSQRINNKEPIPEFEQIGELYEFNSTKELTNGLNLRFDLKSVQKDEEAIRKVGLYRQNTENGEWKFIAGANDKYVLNTTLSELGQYGVFYDENFVAIPQKFMLHQNYPNPFNPITTIKYDLPEAEKVTLTIFNVLGQKIQTLVSKEMEAGFHKTLWKGRNENGETVTSGVYFYRLQAGKKVVNKKMILIR